MTVISKARRLAAAVSAAAFLAGAVPAFAQEFSDTHLRAARATIDSLNATAEFDMILPAAAQALKAELIQKDPNLQEQIIAIVDRQALSLAARRGDLEREAAMAYARVFSEEDLQAIAAFYTSEAGRRLIEQGPIVTREVLQAAEIWQRGLARDLAIAVGEEVAAAAAAASAPAQ
jgi:hypothetical protein